MARKMHPVAVPQANATHLVIEVDPLTVPRGHRALPRGAVHGSARRPSRARAKRQWRRQFDRERYTSPGPLV